MTQVTQVTQRPPSRRERSTGCVRWWLDGLPPDECLLRWPHQGAPGFYAHERDYLLRFSPFPDVRTVAEHDRAERERRKAEREAARHGATLEAIREARTALDGLRLETPGTVHDAALRASQLYMRPRVPRTLKQCLAIAAAERLVAYGAIQAYLAGVGARVLWARIAPEEVWYPTREEPEQAEPEGRAAPPEP